jgi:hypothetical protein
MAIGRIPEAGTGIPESIVDAKGDLITATAADTPARLAVGSNNQTLVADSSTATGLKYAASLQSTLTTTGDIIYASAANTPARLGIGSSGQVLTVASGIPSWAAASAGKLLQVVSATTATEVINTSTSYVDTGLTASITPSASTSKILVLTQQVLAIGGTADAQASLRLLRGATQLMNPANYEVYLDGRTQITQIKVVANLAFLDSPSTTSSTTYKTQMVKNGGSGCTSNADSSTSSIILLEIGA